MTGPLGAVALDNLTTTRLVLNSAGGHDAYVYLTSDAALTNLTVKATTLGSSMALENSGPSFYAFNSTHDVHAINILASGQSSDAKIESNWDNAILVGGHLGAVTIAASGENATAGATATMISSSTAATIVAENGIGSASVTASGVGSDAHIYGSVAIGALGDIGSVSAQRARRIRRRTSSARGPGSSLTMAISRR